MQSSQTLGSGIGAVEVFICKQAFIRNTHQYSTNLIAQYVSSGNRACSVGLSLRKVASHILTKIIACISRPSFRTRPIMRSARSWPTTRNNGRKRKRDEMPGPRPSSITEARVGAKG